jgi:hypothetical protein
MSKKLNKNKTKNDKFIKSLNDIKNSYTEINKISSDFEDTFNLLNSKIDKMSDLEKKQFLYYIKDYNERKSNMNNVIEELIKLNGNLNE